jgi:hypothetical protein
VVTSGIPALQLAIYHVWCSYPSVSLLCAPRGPVPPSLAYNQVLSSDWLLLRRGRGRALPNLFSGVVHSGRQPSSAISREVNSLHSNCSAAALSHTTPNSLATNVGAQFSGTEKLSTHQHQVSLCTIHRLTQYSYLPASRRSCICGEPLGCYSPSTSAFVPSATPMTHTTSVNLLPYISLRHHVTHSRMSMFPSDIPPIQRALDMPPHMPILVQCWCLPLHIIRGLF